MSSSSSRFVSRFAALTGFAPFPWQGRLFTRLVAADVPAACDIPTGMGKTSIIPIWLLALAERVERGHSIPSPTRAVYLPRRLAYVVNRRTIVDQATAAAEQIIQRLAAGDPALKGVCAALQRLSADPSEPVAVSTLRGAWADNGDWSRDPARPAIVIGTVDMLGSKLLFSGYGSSFRTRPHQAGLVGQDTLFVHDEAHLTPAFGDLLQSIRREQVAASDPWPIRVTELTATQRAGSLGDALELDAEDRADAEIGRRLHASKRLAIQPVDDVPAALSQRALELGAHEAARILVFVRSPGDATKVERALRRGKVPAAQLAVLTGTLRGYERDKLVAKESFRAFTTAPDRRPLTSSVYLVATSAGEVGLDIDADHLVCDLTTLDSMIQRLGRVNRLGRGSATVDVFVGAAGRKRSSARSSMGPDPRLLATEEALRSLPTADGRHDASPACLRRLAGRREAFAEIPRTVPVTDVHLDRWSMTSVRGVLPGREPVQPFLHGVTSELPETQVAWRAELSDLLTRPSELSRVVDTFPLQVRELLSAPTRVVVEALIEIGTRDPKLSVALVDEGEWRACRLAADAGESPDRHRRRLESRMAWKTVVLPSLAGGISDEGLLDPAVVNIRNDVADDLAAVAQSRFRVLLRRADDDRWSASALDGSKVDLPPGLLNLRADSPALLLDAIEKITGYGVEVRVDIPGEDLDDPERVLAFLVRAGADLVDVSESTGCDQSLAFHLGAAERHARGLVSRLELGDLGAPLAAAARRHDLGKDRPSWQRAIGNTADVPLAKTRHNRFNHSSCAGYRHELGSLHDVVAENATGPLPDADLMMHLIASHHGRARPHFDRRAFDKTRTTSANETVAGDAVTRFARLVRRHGRWGLAWLEALHHAADVQGSLEPEVRLQAEGA